MISNATRPNNNQEFRGHFTPGMGGTWCLNNATTVLLRLTTNSPVIIQVAALHVTPSESSGNLPIFAYLASLREKSAAM
jgi:hypothetical protein